MFTNLNLNIKLNNGGLILLHFMEKGLVDYNYNESLLLICIKYL